MKQKKIKNIYSAAGKPFPSLGAQENEDHISFIILIYENFILRENFESKVCIKI